LNDATAIALSLYPIPATDKLLIVCEEKINGVEILDMTGRRVYHASAINNVETAIEVSAFATGSYVVKISTDKGVTAKKVSVR
jgi:hypothetical protein